MLELFEDLSSPSGAGSVGLRECDTTIAVQADDRPRVSGPEKSSGLELADLIKSDNQKPLFSEPKSAGYITTACDISSPF